MNLLVLDFETTGVDPQTCHPIEFGARLYNTKTKERGAAFDCLIYEKYYPELTGEITELTGINQEELAKSGCAQDVFISMAQGLLKKADMLVAYNVGFDRVILDKLHHDFQMRAPALPWYCAYSDFPWPERLQRCGQLQHRALDLGLPMDGRPKHRAMADVDTVCDIFDLWDMPEVLEWHRQPWLFVTAVVPAPWTDNGAGRDLAKAHGFGWEKARGTDAPSFPKKWVKRVKSYDAAEYPFPTELRK